MMSDTDVEDTTTPITLFREMIDNKTLNVNISPLNEEIQKIAEKFQDDTVPKKQDVTVKKDYISALTECPSSTTNNGIPLLKSQGLYNSNTNSPAYPKAKMDSILGMIDTIHDFWPGGRNGSQSNENADKIHDKLTTYYKELYGCTQEQMDEILNECIKCKFGSSDDIKNNMKSKDIEATGKKFFEFISSLGNNPVVNISYNDFLNTGDDDDIIINDTSIKLKNATIIKLTNTDKNYNKIIKDEIRRKELAKKIINFFASSFRRISSFIILL